MTAPAAEGVRVDWDTVPEPVRAAIEQICGAPVVRALSQPGGFSPSVAMQGGPPPADLAWLLRTAG